MLQNYLFKSITKTDICWRTGNCINLGTPLPQNPVRADERQPSDYTKLCLRSRLLSQPLQ